MDFQKSLHLKFRAYDLFLENLVAQEYILCQEDKTRPGVLIMSEFTRTASLFKSKFTLNPFDCDLMAQRYHDAIEMSDEDRKQMHDDVVNVVKMYSLSKSVRGICESIDFQSEVA